MFCKVKPSNSLNLLRISYFDAIVIALQGLLNIPKFRYLNKTHKNGCAIQYYYDLLKLKLGTVEYT